MPFAMTLQMSETSGIIARTKAPQMSTRMMRSVRRRRGSTCPSRRRSSSVSGDSVSLMAMSVRPREFLAPRDDAAGSEIDEQRDDEQRETGRDQGRATDVVRVVEPGRDVGGDGLLLARDEQLERVEQPGRQDHEDGHGLAERAAEAEHRGGRDAGAAERQ